jgi:hypothetical protein
MLAGHATAQGFRNGPHMGFVPNSGFFPHRGFFTRAGFFPHPNFFRHSRFFPHHRFFLNHAFIGRRFFTGIGFPAVPVVILPPEPFIDTTPVQLPSAANETAADPEIIVLSGQRPERLAPQTAPDYSYVSGCRAISNGYHCDFSSK